MNSCGRFAESSDPQSDPKLRCGGGERKPFRRSSPETSCRDAVSRRGCARRSLAAGRVGWRPTARTRAGAARRCCARATLLPRPDQRPRLGKRGQSRLAVTPYVLISTHLPEAVGDELLFAQWPMCGGVGEPSRGPPPCCPPLMLLQYDIIVSPEVKQYSNTSSSRTSNFYRKTRVQQWQCQIFAI